MSKAKEVLKEEKYPKNDQSIQESTLITKKEETTDNDGYCSWIVSKNNSFFPTEKIITIPKLIPGKYRIIYDNYRNSYGFIRENINSDELLDLPSPIFKSILNDIDYFWEHKELFEKYNYVHKRGVFLHGPAGCGKTSICTRLSKQVIEKGGIVLYVNDPGSLEMYDSCIPNIFRLIEPNTKILTIFEDLDGLIKHDGYETMLLNILDGNNQLNNVVYVGCSNYPELLKDRILNRPSRFDRRYLIDKPNAEMREYYFRKKISPDDYDDEIIKNIVTKTEGLTIAHLGEFVKSVYIFKMDIDETISLLNGMSEFISSKRNMDSNKKLGFNK